MTGNPDYDGDGWDWPGDDERDEPRDQCVSCGAEIDHYLGCPDDPDPDYEAEAAAARRWASPLETDGTWPGRAPAELVTRLIQSVA